jgi:hypothetical protein
MIKDFLKNERVVYILTLLATVAAYGIFINIPMHSVFNRPFTIMSALGYGIIAFFIKYELPRLWGQLFPRR